MLPQSLSILRLITNSFIFINKPRSQTKVFKCLDTGALQPRRKWCRVWLIRNASGIVHAGGISRWVFYNFSLVDKLLVITHPVYCVNKCVARNWNREIKITDQLGVTATRCCGLSQRGWQWNWNQINRRLLSQQWRILKLDYSTWREVQGWLEFTGWGRFESVVFSFEVEEKVTIPHMENEIMMQTWTM